MLLRTVYFALMILLPYATEQYFYWRFVTKNRERERHAVKKTLTGYGWAYLWDLAHFALLVATGYRFIVPDQPFSLWHWLGWGLFLAGVLLRIWALKELGPFYAGGTIIQKDHQVIDTGPYRYYRHPLHLGTTVQISGLAAFAPIWLGLPAILLSFTLTIAKDRREDQALSSNLGQAYQRYYEGTWDIVDLIFRKGQSGTPPRS